MHQHGELSASVYSGFDEWRPQRCGQRLHQDHAKAGFHDGCRFIECLLRVGFANSSALISANKGEVACSVAVDVEKTNIFAFVMNFIERSLISNIGSSKSTIKKYAIGFLSLIHI